MFLNIICFLLFHVPVLFCSSHCFQDVIGNDPATVIYTDGCINQGDEWFQLYMVPVAGVIVAVSLIQVVIIRTCIDLAA